MKKERGKRRKGSGREGKRKNLVLVVP
jgi:hypothetical protein